MPLDRRVTRIAAAAAVAVAVGTTAPAGAAGAGGGTADEVYRVPANGTFLLRGHGYGHGHGMSQFGAYGAALKGLTYRQILDFYYPNTTFAGRPLASQVRVLLHGTSTRTLQVAQDKSRITVGTTVKGVDDCRLPLSVDGGKTDVQSWRAKVVSTPDGARLRLQMTSDGTSWTHLPAAACGEAWTQPLDGSIDFAGPHATRLLRPAGTSTRYRGTLRAAFTGSHLFVVNVAPLDSYLRSVVPSEMPSSWSPAALRAQAVAARTYASYGVEHPKNKRYYDVFDDTRDQMYTGVGSEISSTDDAVSGTEDPDKGVGYVLEDSAGRAAFTQFSSSDGGWTVSGGQPYLPAKRDPYDGVPKLSWNPHSWTTTIPVATIESAYGSALGSLRSLVVTGRDGNGQWGGRITGLTLHGSSADVALTGASFRYAFGLRSEWFRVVLPPTAPGGLVVRRSGSDLAVRWTAPTGSGRASVSGYRVQLHPGGSHTVGKDTTSTSLSGLDAKTDYTVSVSATSAAGPGAAAKATSKVQRLSAGSRAELAATVSRATFRAGAARAVVLVRQAGGHALAAGPLAAAAHAPVLSTGTSTLPAATRTELTRVLPRGRTVYLLGPDTVIGTDVRSALRAMGYAVRRIGGDTPALTARHVANVVASMRTVSRVFEVSASDRTSAWAAWPAAATHHGVILLTDGSHQSSATAGWLAHHPAMSRFAIGAGAATADPTATAVRGDTPAGVATAVAHRFFTSPARAAVVAPGTPMAGMTAAARLALTHGPLLYADGTALASGTKTYVTGVRAALRRVDLIGSLLPYADVERDLQRSLLG